MPNQPKPKTGITITKGTVVSSTLGVIIGAFITFGIAAMNYGAEKAALESTVGQHSKDIATLVSEGKEDRKQAADDRKTVQDLSNTLVRISTQLDSLLADRTARVQVTPSQSQNRTVVVTRTPSQPQNSQNPVNPPPQEQPEPSPLQPAENIVQRLLADVRGLL